MNGVKGEKMSAEHPNTKSIRRTMHDTQNLAQWLNDTSQGSQRAFERLYSAASPKLFAVLLRIVKKPDLAEDILQDVFVKIWQHAADYCPDKGAPMNWMARIARNQALDRLRKLGREPRCEEPESWEWIGDLIGEPLDATQADCDMQRAMRCLADLQEPQRRCLLLAYYYGYTHEELAAELGAPLGTVKSWIRRGLVKARNYLEVDELQQP